MLTFSSILFAATAATLAVRWINAGGGFGGPSRPAGA